MGGSMIDQRVEGRDIRGKLVTLKRSSPEQLSLFQTFLPDEDKYSNTIELYDAIPKYYPIKHMRNKRVNDTFLPHLEREFEHKGNAYRLTHLARPRHLQQRHSAGILPQFPGGTGRRSTAQDRLRPP